MGHPHTIERPLQIGAPEREELVELGKARGKVVLLPDELLQDRAVVRHAVENTAWSGHSPPADKQSHVTPSGISGQGCVNGDACSKPRRKGPAKFQEAFWHSCSDVANKSLACWRGLD